MQTDGMVGYFTDVWVLGTKLLGLSRYVVAASNGIAGKIALGLLIAAGVGEAMASVFDINHPLHNLAGMISVLGLPIAAMLIGQVHNLGVVFVPGAASMIPLVLMVMVLIWRPGGLVKAGV